MADASAPAWKIGRLADEAGLTVRTLHHYDHLGLVRPSARTAAGHRIYVQSDVERLYQVLTLRQLGLPLDTIGDALAGSVSIASLMRQQREHLDRQLAAMRALRAQLGTMLAAAEAAETATVPDFLELIRKVTTVDDTIKRYFTQEQLASLAERRAEFGEQAIAETEARWPELIAEVQAAVDSGVDPTSAEARAMASEWMGLVRQFHGDNEGVRDSLNQMYRDNAEQVAQQPDQQQCGPSLELMEFINRASAADR